MSQCAEIRNLETIRPCVVLTCQTVEVSEAQFGNIVLQILKFSLIPSLFPIKKILKIVMLTANIFTVIQIAPTFSSIISILHDLPSLTSSILNFKRGDVVQLSKLISRYLTAKPYQIDSNRIYQCISECYKDVTQNYNDNPAYYSIDMHMLLTTCIASTWFTPPQIDNIQSWVREQSW